MSVFKVGEPTALLVAGGTVKVDGRVLGFGDRDVTVSVEMLAPNAEKVLRREGWRARLVLIESLLRTVAAHGTDEREGGAALDVALGHVVNLIDGDTKPSEGLVRLSAAEVNEIAWWEDAYIDAGESPWLGLMDRLRREVNP